MMIPGFCAFPCWPPPPQPPPELTAKVRHNLLRGLVVSGCICRFYAFGGDEGGGDGHQDLEGDGPSGVSLADQVTEQVGCRACERGMVVDFLGGECGVQHQHHQQQQQRFFFFFGLNGLRMLVCLCSCWSIDIFVGV